MDAADIGGRLDRSLKQLRAPRAPLTLLPRVMAAVQAWAGRPWYQRAWFTWPAGWQVAAMAALILLAVGGTLLLPMGLIAVRVNTPVPVAEVSSHVSAIAERLWTAVTIVQMVVRSLVAPALAYAFAVVVLMGFLCGAAAWALSGMTVGRALRS